MSRKAANIISAQVIMKPDCVLGLATGGTPVGTYEKLVERYNEGDLDFSEVTSVNLDEYRGLPKDHPESYWSFMHRNLFDHVNIDPAHINLPDGTNLDAEAECKRYDEVIRSVGGVDLQLLGIGHDGHIGFNEPHDAFDLGTHCVDLAQETIEANKRFFDGNVDLVPKQAYTMGIRTIMQARKVLMVVNGAGKAEIVKKELVKRLPDFMEDIQEYFSDLLTRGREVTVRVNVDEGSNISLADVSAEGDTYSDYIVDYIKKHTVKGAYKLQSNTDNALVFTGVRIKLLNSDGTQYGVYDWTRDLARAMRKDLGVKVQNRAQGLGEVVLTLQGI